MTQVEYKVVPAPKKAAKAKGIKGAEAQFAHGFEVLMNDMAADGWHYLRSETLPHEARAGLTSVTTTYRHILVFTRKVMDPDAELLKTAKTAVDIPPQEIREDPPITTTDPVIEAVTEEAAPIETQLDEDHTRLRSVFDDQR